MKKTSLLLALVMLLGVLALPALAEGTRLTKVTEVNRAEILPGTNLILFRNEGFGKAGLMNAQGEVIVPNEYYEFKLNNTFGYIKASKLDDLNGLGIISAEGKELIPFEYGEFEALNEDWVQAIKLKEATQDNYDYKSLFGGYGTGYYLIDRHDFYNMKTGKLAGSVARDDLDKVYAYPGFLIIKDPKGVNTVYDENFQALGTIEQSYNPFAFEKGDGGFVVKRAADGQVLVTSPYEVNAYNQEDSTFRISKDGKSGLMDFTGKVLVEPVFAQIQGAKNGYARAKEAYDGKFALVDTNGKAVTGFDYDEIHQVYDRGITYGAYTNLVINGYAAVEKDGKLGFVNEAGQETLAPTYASQAVKRNGNTLLVTDATGASTIVAADGQVTALDFPSVDTIEGSLGGRLFLAKNAEGKVTVLDWHGKELLPFGNYSDYGAKLSNDGSLLLMENTDSRMIEVYSVEE